MMTNLVFRDEILRTEPWCDKLKYLGVVFQCKTGATYISIIRTFYSQINIVLLRVEALKSYVPCTIVWLWKRLTNSSIIHKVNVAWNNCFGWIFSCCWQQSVKPLQYFTETLCMSSIRDQSRLIFWKRMHMSQNIHLSILSRFVSNRFVATGSVYGINCVAVSFSAIKNSVWATFASHVLQSL